MSAPTCGRCGKPLRWCGGGRDSGDGYWGECDCRRLERWREAEKHGLPVVPMFPELETAPAQADLFTAPSEGDS